MGPVVSNLLIENDYNSSNQRTPTTQQTFRDALAKSYTISEDFMSFCIILLSFVARQYCHRCLIDPMNFVFAIWCVGVFMVSIGVVYLITCPDSLVVAFYLLIDGTLSVFLYPLLLANRPQQIDHSENDDLNEDQEESGDPRWWLAVLIIRSLTLFIWSTALPIYHSWYHQVNGPNSRPPIFPNLCATHYPVAMASVLFGWTYVLCILIPLLFCLMLFQLTPILVGNQLSMTALPL